MLRKRDAVERNANFPRLIITCSLVAITASCYMVQFFTDLCFVEHSLTDSIDENLGGNVGNLFLPLGWVSIYLFVASIILLMIFSSWGKVSLVVTLSYAFYL